MRLLKKISLVAAILIAANSLLMAQLSLGVRGGVNLAKQSSEGSGVEITTDNITGLMFAGIAEVGLTKSFAIQPELVFVQKGGKIEDFELVLNHFEVPILVKYKFGTDMIGAFVAAGPSFGYSLSGKADGEKIEDDEWDDYNRFEIGANFGAGVGIKMGAGMVFLDARYLLGLSNIADNEFDEDFKSHNKGIGLSIGYLHNLGE
jgi:hypothetical protein